MAGSGPCIACSLPFRDLLRRTIYLTSLHVIVCLLTLLDSTYKPSCLHHIVLKQHIRSVVHFIHILIDFHMATRTENCIFISLYHHMWSV